MKRVFLLPAALFLIAGCTPGPSTTPTSAVATDTVKAWATTSPGEGGVVKLTADNTKVTFVGTKPGGKHEGGFKTVKGTVQFLSVSPGGGVAVSPGTPASIEVEFDTDSLWADDAKLTNHLKSPDFFDVKKFPTATFVSTKIEPVKGKEGSLTVTGDLTLHGVKKSISFPATSGNDKGQFTLSSSFKINRTDYGMTFGEGKVDNEVSVAVTVGQPAK